MLMLMSKMKIPGKFEQKTQKSICLQNKWKLKNINKAIVVKIWFLTNFWPILKKLSQKIDFLLFPFFEIFVVMSIKETNRVRRLCTWPLRAEKWSQRFWRPRLIQRHLICAHILLQSLTTMRQSLHCVRLVPIPDLTKVLLMMAHWVMRWKLWLWTIVLMSGAVHNDPAVN